MVDELTNTPNNMKNISKGSTLSNAESQGIEYNRKSAEQMDSKNQILPIKNKVKGLVTEENLRISEGGTTNPNQKSFTSSSGSSD